MVKKPKTTAFFFFFFKDTCSHNKISDLIYYDIFKHDSKIPREGWGNNIAMQGGLKNNEEIFSLGKMSLTS